jgi:hypothetical protein
MKYHPMDAGINHVLAVSVVDLEHLGRVHRFGFDVVRAREEFRMKIPRLYTG